MHCTHVFCSWKAFIPNVLLDQSDYSNKSKCHLKHHVLGLILLSLVSFHDHSVQGAQCDMLCQTIVELWEEDWRKIRARYNPACGNTGWTWHHWSVLWYTREVHWSWSPPNPYLPTYITITYHPPPPNNGWHLSDWLTSCLNPEKEIVLVGTQWHGFD